jgi:hypothetical protein
MKDLYEIDRESLVELSKKIYEEACLGYMDLKESVCENLVEEFLKDKSVKKTEEATNLSWTVNTPGNWDGGIGIPAHFGSGTTLTIGGVDPALETAGIVITSVGDVVLRNPDQDMLRGNYHGNESERM